MGQFTRIDAPIWSQNNQTRYFDGRLTLSGVFFRVDSEFVVRKQLDHRNMVPYSPGLNVKVSQFPSVGGYTQSDKIFELNIKSLFDTKNSFFGKPGMAKFIFMS